MDVAYQGETGGDRDHRHPTLVEQLGAIGVSHLVAEHGTPTGLIAVAPFDAGAAFSVRFDRPVTLVQASEGSTVFLAPAPGLGLELDGEAATPEVGREGVLYAGAGSARIAIPGGARAFGVVVATAALAEHAAKWFPGCDVTPRGRLTPCRRALSEALGSFVEFLVRARGGHDALGQVSRERCRAALLDLLAENLAEQPSVAPWSASPGYLKRAEAFVFANLSREITAAEAAAAAGVSVRSLYRAFQEFRGLTFGQFLRNARMDSARELLRQRTDVSLRSVAQQVGYPDYTSFWRHFRARFGVSPRAEGERIPA